MRGLLLVGACLIVQMAGAEPVTTEAFRATRTFVFVPGAGPTTAACDLSYPAQSQSEPGQYAQWPLTALSPATDAALAFDWADSFTGPTAGYHFLQVLLGDRVLWEQDVAGGDAQFHRVEVALLTVGSHACGKGRVICTADGAGVLTAVQPFAVSPVTATAPVGVFGHTGRNGRRALALLGLEGEIGEVTVKLPPDAKDVELRLPGRAPQALTPAPALTCRIPERLGLIVY